MDPGTSNLGMQVMPIPGGMVRVSFTKEVQMIQMTANQAIELASTLRQSAKESRKLSGSGNGR